MWDGRGDRLTDARFSTLSGRAADDLRLGAVHMRLLLHVGRQNATRGWLRLSQSELARQWRCSRQTVNRCIGELEGWRYIERSTQQATGESFCHYRISHADGLELGGVSPPGDTGGVSPPGDTSVAQLGDTGVAPQATPPFILPTNADSADLSPLPPEGGRAGGTRTRKRAEAGPRWAAAVLARLLAEPRHEVAAKLLTPLCRLLDPPKSGDGEAWCEHLARRLVDTPGPVLAAAADALLDVQGHRVPPVPAVLEAVKAAAAASRVGADVVVKRGSPEHAAWIAYERALAGKSASWEPQWARHEVWGKPTRWPPGHEPVADAAGTEARRIHAPDAEWASEGAKKSVAIPYRCPRWEAWLAYWTATPGEVPASLPGELRRQRRAFNAPADWPPGTASQHNGGWHIPADSPEHAAWLAHLRRADPVRAQAIDVGSPNGRAPLTRPSRWPPIPAAEPAPATTHATTTSEPRP